MAKAPDLKRGAVVSLEGAYWIVEGAGRISDPVCRGKSGRSGSFPELRRSGLGILNYPGLAQRAMSLNRKLSVPSG